MPDRKGYYAHWVPSRSTADDIYADVATHFGMFPDEIRITANGSVVPRGPQRFVDAVASTGTTESPGSINYKVGKRPPSPVQVLLAERDMLRAKLATVEAKLADLVGVLGARRHRAVWI